MFFKHKSKFHTNIFTLFPVDRLSAIIIVGLIFLFAGCNIFDRSGGEIIETYEYNFAESEHNWEPFFTDYNVDQEESMELEAEYRTLPEPLNSEQNAQFISALNRSDDVKMMFRRQVHSLEPDATYDVEFEIHFATEVPSGCAGIGGAPGESVKVIADGSNIKPEKFVDDMDWYRLNIQHQNDPGGWYRNVIMGDIANSRECEDGYEYEIKKVESNRHHTTIDTDNNGSAWLMFGTRSGFEGQTDLYYTYFRADFRER